MRIQIDEKVFNHPAGQLKVIGINEGEVPKSAGKKVWNTDSKIHKHKKAEIGSKKGPSGLNFQNNFLRFCQKELVENTSGLENSTTCFVSERGEGL
ncbi:hypothetical protein AKJ51_00870 [candidate division MSBL1 archaeon SCGC-AAA382A20]|uniref:Uncharacterized protein n=1 Tax=candidate division MSBL1 archaeon SCGC-AAA382A20 TaxID=1698280 RepID=A0A133VMG4_9EURY|nr:hypothetical protein AKJ51_00870 [candidate division MSBL1 archaeon SCGC-AAA382A20]